MSAQAPAPAVTVLMAVHDGAEYLKEAVASVLGQTFRDFEFLVIDDGSTDATPAVLASFADPRLRVVRQENRGLAAALNRGLYLARGKYVARMDADDVCLPRRLERQVAFMDRHPTVAASGTWVRARGGGRTQEWRYPTDPAEVRCRLLFHTVLAHPSVILRRDVLAREGLAYDEAFHYAQDYDLWERASRRVDVANLGEVLLEYRVGAWEGAGKRDRQRPFIERIHRRALAALAIEPTAAESALHYALAYDEWQTGPAAVDAAEAWLSRLAGANARLRAYPGPAFERMLGERWRAVCRSALESPGVPVRFLRSPLSRPLGLRSRAGLAVRAVARALRTG